MAASILAVDDSASMRQMVSFTLKGAGYDVVEASDGVQALNIAKTRAVNLVITDVNMPNMDGIALIRELRTLSSYKFTPLLMLTTESSNDKKQAGKLAGATGWIVKPFNPDLTVGGGGRKHSGRHDLLGPGVADCAEIPGTGAGQARTSASGAPHSALGQSSVVVVLVARHRRSAVCCRRLVASALASLSSIYRRG